MQCRLRDRRSRLFSLGLRPCPLRTEMYFFWNVLQVWMTGKDIYLQMTWSWPDKTWNILCSYCLQWNTSQSKFRNHYFLFLFAFSILSQLFLIWGCTWSFRNHANMLMCCSRKINVENSLLLQTLVETMMHFFVEHSLMKLNLLKHYKCLYCHFWSI